MAYENETVITKKTSGFVPLKGRPTFSWVEETPQDVNEDLRLLTKPSQVAREKWEGCHSNFLDYVGQLGSLMGDPAF